MDFPSKRSTTRWEGLAAVIWIVLIDLLLLVWALRRPIDILQFLLILLLAASIPLLLHLGYRTWAAFTLEYWVDRNAVTLRWAQAQQVIPTQSIRQILHGAELAVEGANLLYWPLHYLRMAPVRQGSAAHNRPDVVNLCATAPPQECVVLETDTGVYALSPADPQAFIDALQERYRLGATRAIEPVRTQQSWLGNIFAHDRIGAWLLAVGLVGVLALFAVLTISFPNLPDVLAVRYNSAGIPEEIREKTALFRLLVIGLLAWSVNGVGGLWLSRQGQRIGAHMLWGGAIAVQAFLLLALVSLIT